MTIVNNALNANSSTPLAVTSGGTGVNAVTTAPTATNFAGWDANSNLSANNFIGGYATTATAASTTTLVVGSAQQQFFTGSTTQTVLLPVTSTLVLGQSFVVVNNSTGVVTVQSSGANTITAMATGTAATFTCILTSGTTAASWSSDYNYEAAAVTSITGTANQVSASASTGAVTLSLPQSIATSSAVQFASVNFGGSALSTYSATQSWTPAITFATVGDLNVSYGTQAGKYTRIGNIVCVFFTLTFTPTYTTASSYINITGLPFTSNSGAGNTASGSVLIPSIITYPAGVTTIALELAAGGTFMYLLGTGSATGGTLLSTTQFISAGTYTINGSITYIV